MYNTFNNSLNISEILRQKFTLFQWNYFSCTGLLGLKLTWFNSLIIKKLIASLIIFENMLFFTPMSVFLWSNFFY